MSTHRITDTTKIPFPCWLWDSTERRWDRANFGPNSRFSEELHECYTHYSTNPPDQRPEDVGDEQCAKRPSKNASFALHECSPRAYEAPLGNTKE